MQQYNCNIQDALHMYVHLTNCFVFKFVLLTFHYLQVVLDLYPSCVPTELA